MLIDRELKESFKNLLQFCEELKKSDRENYDFKEITPILDHEGFVNCKSTTKRNYIKFILNHHATIVNSKPLKEIAAHLIKYDPVKEYLSSDLVDENGDKISNPKHSEISELNSELVIQLLLSYLLYTDTFVFHESHFQNVYRSMISFFDTDHRIFYCFIPIYGLRGEFQSIRIDDNLEIKLLSNYDFAKVTNLDISKDENVKPDKKFWKLRYGLYMKFEVEGKMLKSFDQCMDVGIRVLNSLRLTKTGMAYLGALYPLSPGLWTRRDLPPRIGVENPPVAVPMLQLSPNDIRNFLAIYNDMAKLDLKSDNKRYILVALRRFTVSYNASFAEDRITDLTIALEVLLTDGPGEIQLKLSLRGALLLGTDEDERESLWQFLKRCYEVRSEIVHGKKRKKNIIGEKEISDNELLVDLEQVTRQSILKIIRLQGTISNQKDLHARLDKSIVNRNKILINPVNLAEDTNSTET